MKMSVRLFSPLFLPPVRFVTSQSTPLPTEATARLQRQRAAEQAEDRRMVLTARGRNKVTTATSLAIVALLPYSVLCAPSLMGDIALGVAIPVHCHVGMTHVIEDYAHKPRVRRVCKHALAALTAATLAAALHFNLFNGGIGLALRRLWNI